MVTTDTHSAAQISSITAAWISGVLTMMETKSKQGRSNYISSCELEGGKAHNSSPPPPQISFLWLWRESGVSRRAAETLSNPARVNSLWGVTLQVCISAPAQRANPGLLLARQLHTGFPRWPHFWPYCQTSFFFFLFFFSPSKPPLNQAGELDSERRDWKQSLFKSGGGRRFPQEICGGIKTGPADTPPLSTSYISH